MHLDTLIRELPYHASKILVIDDDPSTADRIAALLPRGACEIIACHDMALAEVATDLTDFDLILVAPCSTGVDGLEGLAVADFLVARNPTAMTTLMVPQADADLKAAVQRRGAFAVVNKPLISEEFLSLWTTLGAQRASVGAA